MYIIIYISYSISSYIYNSWTNRPTNITGRHVFFFMAHPHVKRRDSTAEWEDIIYIDWLVVSTYPSEKSWKVRWDYEIPNI